MFNVKIFLNLNWFEMLSKQKAAALVTYTESSDE